MSQDGQEKRLNHVERDVAEIRGRFGAVETRLDAVDNKLGAFGDGMQQLLRRDAERAASQPYAFKDILDMAVKGFVLVGMTVSAIIYVAAGHSAVDMALMKERVAAMTRPSSWTPTTRRGP